MTYNINYTDKSKQPIVVEDENIDTSLGIRIFGRNRLSYGQEAQENLLRLLESFSAPEDPNNPDNPDISQIVDNTLSGPIEGHLWFNSTKKVMYYFNDSQWQPVSNKDDIAANWGVIADGGTLPKPISSLTGKVFGIDECVWITSPFSLPQLTDGFSCTTDDNAVVSMKYYAGETELKGYANYMIIGISGNRSERAQTITYTLNNYNTTQVINSKTVLAAQCIPLIKGDLSGMDCNGATMGCSTGNCAPRTGIDFTLSFAGGNPPYTAKLVNITRNETSTECISFGYNINEEKLHTNSKSFAASATLGTIDDNVFGPISILSDCGSVATPITGTITIAVEDSAGHKRNVYVKYASERIYPNQSVNELPYDTDPGCGNGEIAKSNLVALGSPNYLYVQPSFDEAVGNTAYYMTRTFDIGVAGTYTMNMYHDDKAWVYLDGVVIYQSGAEVACSARPASISMNMTSGSHQLMIGYENSANLSPAYVVFSIYDPSNNLFYTSNKNGWLAASTTSGISV